MLIKITKDTPKNITSMQDYEFDKLLLELDSKNPEKLSRHNEELEYQAEKKVNPLADNLVGPKDQVKSYYIFGHRFGMRNDVARGAFYLRTRDERYPEYSHAKNISQLYEASIVTDYEKELNGRKLSDVPWDEVKSWLKDFLISRNPNAKNVWTNPDGSENEYKLLSYYGAVIFREIKNIETYY